MRYFIVALITAFLLFGIPLAFMIRPAGSAEVNIELYCQNVRDLVGKVGIKRAEQDARAAGVSEAMIAAARKCLK
jgi:hypothetical protein